MQRKVIRRIERYLDEQLGLWTRLLPWRREIAVHIEEAYQTAQAEAPESTVDDANWQRALADFGDVQDVARKLQKEHWPQHLGWRILAVVVSAWIVISILHPWRFLTLSALGFSMRSALYCVLFFTPRRSIVIALVTIVVVDMGLVILPIYDYSVVVDSATALERFLPGYWNVDGWFVMRVLAICSAGICAGISRFGFHGMTRHAPSIGAGIFLMSLILQFGDMSDPGKMIAHFLVAIGAMALAIAGSYCISDSSRFVRRIPS